MSQPNLRDEVAQGQATMIDAKCGQLAVWREIEEMLGAPGE